MNLYETRVRTIIQQETNNKTVHTRVKCGIESGQSVILHHMQQSGLASIVQTQKQ